MPFNLALIYLPLNLAVILLNFPNFDNHANIFSYRKRWIEFLKHKVRTHLSGPLSIFDRVYMWKPWKEHRQKWMQLFNFAIEYLQSLYFFSRHYESFAWRITKQ